MNTEKRKVIQIVTAAYGQGHLLFALCDDGTMWKQTPSQGWQQERDIPQPSQATERRW